MSPHWCIWAEGKAELLHHSVDVTMEPFCLRLRPPQNTCIHHSKQCCKHTSNQAFRYMYELANPNFATLWVCWHCQTTTLNATTWIVLKSMWIYIFWFLSNFVRVRLNGQCHHTVFEYINRALKRYGIKSLTIHITSHFKKCQVCFLWILVFP